MDVFGPEKTVLNECLALEAAGWRARIVNLWESEDVPMSHKARSAGARYEVLRTAGKFDIAAIRALARQLRAEPDVVVHSHGYKADLYTLLAARMAGVPVMTSAHGWTSENAKVRLYERLQAYLWRWFDRVVAVFPDGRAYAWHQLSPDAEQ